MRTPPATPSNFSNPQGTDADAVFGNRPTARSSTPSVSANGAPARSNAKSGEVCSLAHAPTIIRMQGRSCPHDVRRATFLEPRNGEVPRMHHVRTSGSVKLHSRITALGQQRIKAKPGRLGVLELTYPQARRPRAAIYHLPELVSVRSPARSARLGAPPMSNRAHHTSSEHLAAMVPWLGSSGGSRPTAHRGKA